MPTITTEQMAAAVSRHKQLATSEALYARCDELAKLQQFMFLELLTFARDGATDSQITELIGFLSVLQYLAESVSPKAATPVKKPEFQEAVKRALLWFKTFDSADKSQMTNAWVKSLERQSGPVIWAWLVSILPKNDILSCSLTQGMVVTLYAIADVYSRRLGTSA